MLARDVMTVIAVTIASDAAVADTGKEEGEPPAGSFATLYHPSWS